MGVPAFAQWRSASCQGSQPASQWHSASLPASPSTLARLQGWKLPAELVDQRTAIACSQKEEATSWWAASEYYIRIHNSPFKLVRGILARSAGKFEMLFCEFVAPPRDGSGGERTCRVVFCPEVPAAMRRCAVGPRKHGAYGKDSGKGGKGGKGLEPAEPAAPQAPQAPLTGHGY